MVVFNVLAVAKSAICTAQGQQVEAALSDYAMAIEMRNFCENLDMIFNASCISPVIQTPRRVQLPRHARLPRPLRAPPVDAFEQHRQLCRAQRDAPGLGLWPDESASLKTLGQQAHAVAIAPQQLDQIAPARTATSLRLY